MVGFNFIFKFKLVFYFLFILGVKSTEAPVLDIEDESIGYIGTIGERNVLVDVKPHLQIKNIESISKY